MTSTHIIIVDDHPLFRDALKAALSGLSDGSHISDAGSFEQLTSKLAASADCDLILLDLKMPGIQGLAGLAYLRTQHPDVPVAIVSGQEEAAIIRRALAMGALGFIPKSTPADTMRKAVSAILQGQVWAPALASEAAPQDQALDDMATRISTLTPQQVRVLMMLREGLLNKQIAFALAVSEATVKAHVSAILTKLNVDSRTQAVIAVSKIDGDIASSVA
jgi:DNA-binding NarL/FixJ family response regulator